MPRKSISDVLTERHGGTWSYLFPRPSETTWVCNEDSRVVQKKITCVCWKIANQGPCNCEPDFFMYSGDTETKINLDDPRVYRLNGTATK
jgi:hypothetical protein